MKTQTHPTSHQASSLMATYALLSLMALLWGLVFIAIKWGGQAMPLPVYNADRFILATILMAAACKISGRWQTVHLREAIELTALGLVGHGLTQMLFASGVMRTSASSASLIWGGAPLLVASLSALFGVEKLTPRQWLGAFIAFAGVGAVVMGGGKGFVGQSVTGDGLVVCAMISMAIYAVWSRSVIAKLDVWFVTTWMMATGSLVMLVWSMPHQTIKLYRDMNLTGWGMIGYGGLFSLLLPNLIFLKGIQEVGRSRASLFVNAVPLVGCVTGWLFMGETMGPLQITGGLVIGAGIALSQWRATEVCSPSQQSDASCETFS
ncbi:MAG: DMT family transporter [Verrucomicrobiota bacterium]